MMTMPYYGTMTTAKAHGKTVQEQIRNTTGQGWLNQDPNNHMTTENTTEQNSTPAKSY